MKKHFNDGTFRGTKHMVKAIALALCFVLLFTSFDTAVFAAEDVEVCESEIELVEESDDIEEQPVEYAETEEPIDDQMILESLPLEVEEVPFEQSITVDDVVITVSADAGVFPEGASVSARKVTISEENEVAEAIDEVRDNDKKVALSYTFDITVCDMDGNEIEPDTEKGSVKVTFKMTEIANINLETEVYHLEETDGGLNVENLDVKSDEGEADEVAVETTGFSFYSVEFTYNELQYVLEGDEKVELTTILDAVGIKENGEISKVEGSDDELFKPVFEDDIWYIEAVKAFNTEEWLKVTIDGIEYEIVVTDNQAPGEWSKLLTALSGSTPSSVENQFEVSSDEDGIIIKLLADFVAGDGATTLTVSGAKKLDLNGHVINANGKSMRVLTIPSGAELTLEDSDTTASHEGYIDADDIWHLGTGTGTSHAIAGGIITGGKVAGDNSGGISDGGGVLVKGTLKMYGGSISGNTLSYTNYSCGGGGIAVADSGVFEMQGGYITYNKAGNGGGVWTYKGIFNMYDDAVISNCKAAASGGGVFVENAPFNMYGGVIEKCEAESGQYGNGGGIFTHTNSTFTMTGGAIKNNTAAGNGAGVHNNSGTVTLGGKARITNNMRGTDYNNLYLPSNHTVYISTTTSPTTGMSVHVTLENGTGKVTNTSGTDQYAQYFGSDKLSNGVVAKDGFVQIVSKTNIVASVNHNDQYIYYDSLQNAINGAGTEDEVQLFRDIQEDISVSTDKNITLDLNGKVLKGTGAESTITVSSGATLTLCDSRVDVVHYYKYNSNGAWTWDDSAIDDAITVEEISDSTATGTPIILKGGAITGGIDTGSSASEGGGIYNSGTLIMQGGTISGNKADLGGGGVYNEGIFVMKDGTIIGNTSNRHGGGVYNFGTFTMIDGTISGNKTGSGYNGGGVYNGQDGASFVMEGGTISGNNASYGAGVYNYGSNVNFTMRGDSAVSNNVGTNGAGVYFDCDGDSIFTVSGNSQINGNEATIGGGVYISNGAFVMDAGIITGNKAGGTVNDYGGGVVLSRSGGTLTISGTAKIIGNVKGGTITDGVLSGGTAQNVYLQTDKNITVGAGNGMKVGVTMKTPKHGVFTTNAADGCLSCFSSDDSAYKVVYDSDNKLMLEKRKYYKVTIDSDITNGTVEIDSDSNYVREGNTVTVTATPNLGYALTSLKYIDGTEDHDITTTKSFTMPEAGVTISAEFEHNHSFTYTANGNILIAKCEEWCSGVYYTNPLTLTLTKPTNLAYDGSEKVITFAVDEKNKWEDDGTGLGNVPSIEYEDMSGSSLTGGKPVNAGNYKASISKGDATAYVEYQVAKADWNVTAPTATELPFTGEEQELIKAGVVKGADGNTVANKMLYSLTLNGEYSNAIPSASAVGDYTVYYKVDGDNNHNAYTVQSIKATIVKAGRTDMPSVTMAGYTYGQTDTLPSPSLSSTPSEEPTITYYYNSTNSFDGASEWNNITATTLDAGTYYMFAKLSKTTSYRECNTEGTEFIIAKATYTDAEPYSKSYLYNMEFLNEGIELTGFIPADAGDSSKLSFVVSSQTVTPDGTESTISDAQVVGNDFTYDVIGMDAYVENASTSFDITVKTQNYEDYIQVIKITRSNCEHDYVDGVCSRCDSVSIELSKDFIIKTMDYSYDEASHNPEIVVTYKGEELVNGINYTYAGDSGTAIGTYDVTITGKGKYIGSKTISWNITPTDGIWCADIPDQVYTGKAIKPAINVYSDGTLLKLGTDYTIAYSNNTKAALSTATNAKGKSIAPTVTINGKGNYKNTKIVRTFTINPYRLNGLEIDPTTVSYTKKPIKLSPVVTLNGKKLKMGTDYIVSTEADGSCEVKTLTDADVYTLYVVGKGNYSGSVPYKFTITKLVPASKVSIGKIANLKYTGEELEPDVSITYKKENVKDDFTIEYKNNTEIGTATVIITAKPGTEFSGSKSATFKIEGTSIAKAVLGADGKGKIEAYTYSGNPCKPEPELYIGTKELENGVDYLLSYKSNVNAGTATMTVTGKGAYTGTKKFTFKINKYDAGVDAGGLIKVNNDELISVKYEKGGVTPKPRVTISINDKEQELKEKTDYTLGYSNNKEAADVNAENPKTHKPVPPTVTITFKGNLSGKQPVKFEITKKDMSQPESGCTLTASDVATKAKTFSWKQAKITITDRNGKKLAAKTDYSQNFRYFSDISCDDAYELTESTLPTVEYPDGKGWVYVKATAAETSKNYEGYVIGRYYVSGINIASVKAVIADQVYTGSEICPTEDMVTVTIKVGKETRTLSAGDPTNPDDGDYTVVPGSYTKNINKGTASLTIRGNGEYFGTKAVKFKIVNKPFEWWENLNL